MDVTRALQMIMLLLTQVTQAVGMGQSTIEVENLGDEHKKAMDELKRYLDAQA